MQNLDLVIGLPHTRINYTLPPCEGCIFGKQHLTPFPYGVSNRALDLLHLIHSDVSGHISTPALSGAKDFVSFIDDYSRCTIFYFINHKNDVFSKFKHYKILVEKQLHRSFIFLRSNNGEEHDSHAFNHFCDFHGLSSQNGILEMGQSPLYSKSKWRLGAQNAHFSQGCSLHAQKRLATQGILGGACGHNLLHSKSTFHINLDEYNSLWGMNWT